MQRRTLVRVSIGSGLLTVSMVTATLAQGRGGRRVQDTLTSPSVAADGRVTFQLYAPKASDVSLRAEGPAPFANQKLVKSDSGVWTLTIQTPPDLYI
jgi:enterochelin esterase family protein